MRRSKSPNINVDNNICTNGLVPTMFTWSLPGKTIFITGNFPKYSNKIILPKTKVGRSTNEFTTVINLPPGKYYYKYEIDGIIKIDKTKPKETYNNSMYNYIIVSNKTPSKPYNQSKVNHKNQTDQETEPTPESLKQLKPIPNTTRIAKGNNMTTSNNQIGSNSTNIIKSDSNHNMNINCHQHDIDNPKDKVEEYDSIPWSQNDNASPNIMDCSNTFSIRNENPIQDMNSSINSIANTSVNNSLSWITSGNNPANVIIYNVGDEYWVEMQVINNLENKVELKFINNNSSTTWDTVLVNKDEIFYQQIEAFQGKGNITSMKYINELSILKNIEYRLNTNKPYLFIDTILLLFQYNWNSNDNKERDYFLDDFLRTKGNKEDTIMLYSNIYNFYSEWNGLNKRVYKDDQYVFKRFWMVNYFELYKESWGLIDSFITYIKAELCTEWNYCLTFDNKDLNVNFIPIFPSNTSNNSNYLWKKSILFTNVNSHSNGKGINSLNSVCQGVILNNIKNEFWKDLWIKRISYNTKVVALINIFMNTLQKIGMEDKIENVISLITLTYLSFYYADIFNNKLVKNEKNASLLNVFKNWVPLLNSRNCIFYSNITVLLLWRYLNTLMNMKLNVFLSKKADLKKMFFVVFSTSSNTNCNNEDDIILLNEVIKARFISVFNPTSTGSNHPISNMIGNYWNVSWQTFNAVCSPMEQKFISLIENLVNLKFLNYNPNTNTIKTIFKVNFNNCIDNFGNHEKIGYSPRYYKQLFNLNFELSFKTFQQKQDLVLNFYKQTNILEYSILLFGAFYNVNNSNAWINTTPKTYFKEYTMHKFFKVFLPVWSDITVKYNKTQVENYKERWGLFFWDLQYYQKIKEEFYVDIDTVKISYITYEVWYLLLKSVIEDHAKTVQSFLFHRKSWCHYIDNVKHCCLIIKRKFHRYLYNTYKKKSVDELRKWIIDKYKGSQPWLIKYMISSKNEIQALIKENNEYQKKIMSKVKTKEDKENWKLQWDDVRNNYKVLVNVVVEYEKKMQNFVGWINSSEEVKEVWRKNGIEIN